MDIMALVNGKTSLKDMITAKQIKAARALLGWKQTDLAAQSGLAQITIRVVERGKGDPRSSTLLKIQGAFEKAGIGFALGGVHFRAESDEGR